MNHLLLHLFAASAAPLIRGRQIATVKYLPPVLVIDLRGDDSTGYLTAVLSNPGPYVYLADTDPLAGVGNEIFRRIHGMSIHECAQPGDDRIIRLELAGGRDRVELVLQVFGGSGKVRILGPDSIIESLDPREAGRPRPAPSRPRGVSLAVIDADALAEALSASHDEPYERTVPGLAPELAECFAGESGERGTIDAARLAAWRDELLRGDCRFHLGTRGRPGAACPLPDPPPRGLPMRFGPFNRVPAACRRVGDYLLAMIRDEMVSVAAAPLKKLLRGRRKLAEELEHNRQTAASFEALRREANVLAAFQSRIPPGSSGVALPDPYHEGKDITIKLDPALPVRDQIDRRFKRAAKLERSLEVIEERIREVRRDIDRLERELAEAAKERTLAETVRRIDAAIERHDIAPRSPHAMKNARQDVSKTKTYRRIELGPMWFVLVGRNNRENDELTFRHAGPDDIWLHAHQVPGSHVILKSRGAPGNPPAAVLELAAGIAAHFSKARHASLVPVIYTRRKYVRKFRGARPGQVRCEREKTLMVEPLSPADVQPPPDPA